MQDIGSNIIVTQESFAEALAAIKGQSRVVVDVETSGLDVWLGDRICGVGICLENMNGYYFPFRHKEKDLPLFTVDSEFTEDNLPLDLLPKLFETINELPTLIGHNLKFDLAALYRDGFDLKENQTIYDTIIGARLYFKDRFARLSLDNLSNTLLGDMPWKKEFKEYQKKFGLTNQYDYTPVDIVGEYCIQDTRSTFQCFKLILKHIDQTKQNVVWEQENKLLKVLWKMERQGLFYDREYCEDRLPRIKARMKELEKELFTLAGKPFQIGSEAQLTEVMNSFGIHSKSKTKTGREQWDQGELLTIEHPIGGLLLEWRALDKLRSTYFEPLIAYREEATLHPTFKSWGTITGRISCERPNLQNLSRGIINLKGAEEIDDEALALIKAKLNVNKAGSETGNVATSSISSFLSYKKSYDELDANDALSVRRLYVAPKDYFMYMIDFSQMEMRVFADYLQDPELNRILESKEADFHDIVAMEVWNVDKTSNMWSFYRNMAKCINFGLIYGIGIRKLAGQMQCSIEEAREFKRKYFSRFPKAQDFMKAVEQRILRRGYIINRFDRRYHLDLESAYRGVNYLVQGSSADIVKNRMIACDEFFTNPQARVYDSLVIKGFPDAESIRDEYISKHKKLKTKLVAQIHDELVFYVHKDEELWVVPEIKKIFEEKCISTFLPSEVSKGFPSWAQKKKICTDCMGIHKKDESCETSVNILGE